MCSKFLYKELGHKIIKVSNFKYSLFILKILSNYAFIFKQLHLKNCKNPFFKKN